jgi:hypothetical protein
MPQGKVHTLFPLVIYQHIFEGHENFKNAHLEELKKYWFNGYENESPEYSGRILLHHDDTYRDMFTGVKEAVFCYLNSMQVDFEKLNALVTKSWVTLHQDNETPSLSPHFHNEANLSFIYYVKTNPQSDRLIIQQKSNQNEFIESVFDSGKNNLITEQNIYNCNTYSITPAEGTIVIMPSKTYHYTQKFYEDRGGERVVVAGDIRITLKPEHLNHHQGCTHPTQWRQL